MICIIFIITNASNNNMDLRYKEVGLCDELLNWSNFSVQNFPRFREAVVETIQPWVVVRTRTGGGNRDYYEKEIDEMRALPHFHHDEDDDFDRTYMYFWYRVPKESMGRWRDFANKTEEQFPDDYDHDAESSSDSS